MRFHLVGHIDEGSGLAGAHSDILDPEVAHAIRLAATATSAQTRPPPGRLAAKDDDAMQAVRAVGSLQPAGDR